jgi:hypothetical protein
MNYLEEEIDDAFTNQHLISRKLAENELKELISALTRKFFKSESIVLDLIELNAKSAEHNPSFWKEIHRRIHTQDLTFLIFDSYYKAWRVKTAQDLTWILASTTGYPFWITDNNLTFLVHMDDHDCVIWA